MEQACSQGSHPSPSPPILLGINDHLPTASDVACSCVAAQQPELQLRSQVEGAGAPPSSSSASSCAGSVGSHTLPKQPITDLDPHRLGQRQKQIDFGKVTAGYQRYLQLLPRNKRRRFDPATPDIHQNISKRCFDGQIKVWRRQLHKYDMEAEEEARRMRMQVQHPSSYTERHNARSTGGGAPPLTECTSLASYSDAACGEGASALLSAGPSSPTNSSGSRGSLDGYLEHHHSHSHHHQEGQEEEECEGWRRAGSMQQAFERTAVYLGQAESTLSQEEQSHEQRWEEQQQGEQRQGEQQQHVSPMLPGLFLRINSACTNSPCRQVPVLQRPNQRQPERQQSQQQRQQEQQHQQEALAAAASVLVPVVVVADTDLEDPIVAYHPVIVTEEGRRVVLTRGSVAPPADSSSSCSGGGNDLVSGGLGGGSGRGQGGGAATLAVPVERVYGPDVELLGFRGHRDGALAYGVAVRASAASAMGLEVGMGAGSAAVVCVEGRGGGGGVGSSVAMGAEVGKGCGGGNGGQHEDVLDGLLSLALE